MPSAKILHRVRVLLDLAARDAGSGESVNAQQKAERLIAKYGVTAAMLAAKDTAESVKRIRRSLSGEFIAYQVDLIHIVATPMGCQVLSLREPDEHETFIGYEAWGHDSDLVRAEILFLSLLVQADALCAALEPDTAVGDFRADWWIGFLIAVQQRVTDNENAARAHYETERRTTGDVGPSVALVLAARADAVADAVASYYMDDQITPGEDRVVPPSGTGRLQGYKAGRAVSFGGTAITSSTPR
jgi:hypothetical protein